MKEYFCPNCCATLNDQPGFEPSCGTWTCTECGMLLMDEETYESEILGGVAWYCDACGEPLNRQAGFTDVPGWWRCTNCGYINGTTENEIINADPSVKWPLA